MNAVYASQNGDRAFAPIDAWFDHNRWVPFDFQREVWESYLAGRSGMVHAPTGMGKTYAAWLGPVIEALHERSHPTGIRVLWITPLRALVHDTEQALKKPLADLGLDWTLETRTGDTSSAVRTRQGARLPHALITTPESLSLLLSRANAEALFSTLRCVVVDEWHELMGTKRGVQTELALARLRRWNPRLRTWGLSATLGNLEEAMETLLGVDSSGESPALISGLAMKIPEISSVVPAEIERYPWAGHLGLKLLNDVIGVIEQAESTLLFTNVRSQAEQWFQALLDARPDWAGVIALHHGSLSREVREWVEDALRDGDLKCVVCTSSLDLGVDFSPVDQVIQVGSPKGVARFLQRAGRSGHRPGATSRIVCVPTNALELIEFSALTAAVTEPMENRPRLPKPFDVLVQHLVTVALGGGFTPEALFKEIRSTATYQTLTQDEWQWTLDFVTGGGAALQAYPEYRRVVWDDARYRVLDRKIAHRHRLAVGTIVSDGAIRVQFMRGATLGTVEESFIARLRPGDRFLFAGRALELVRVSDMTAWVRKAPPKDLTVPRWMGGRMPLSTELATAMRQRLDQARTGVYVGAEMEAVRPLLELQARKSMLPASGDLLIERIHDRDGFYIFFYPFEGRLVHEGLAALFAYRLAQRRPTSFSLAANDYGIALLSPTEAALDEALRDDLFSIDTLDRDIILSMNASELARREFREIARIAGLIFQGFPGSRKTTRQVQASSGLFFDVFSRWDPDNLLVAQARRDVLEKKFEYARLRAALGRMAACQLHIVQTPSPSPLAFPLIVDRLRDSVSSEKLSERVKRMQVRLEKDSAA